MRHRPPQCDGVCHPHWTRSSRWPATLADSPFSYFQHPAENSQARSVELKTKQNKKNPNHFLLELGAHGGEVAAQCHTAGAKEPSLGSRLALHEPGSHLCPEGWGHPGSCGLPCRAMSSGQLTFPSGTLLYPLKCRGPGTVGLEWVDRWGSRQEARQKGRQAQQHSRM